MTRKFFSAGLSILCFSLILCALAATLGMQLLGDLKTYVQISLKNVEQTTGYRITLDDIGWDIFEGTGIRVDNLVLYDAAGAIPLFECRKVHVKFDILPLVNAKLIVSRVLLDDPHFTVHRTGKGSWTLPPLSVPVDTGSISSLDAFSDFSIALKRFTINGGSLHFNDTFRNVKFDLHNMRLNLQREKKTGSFGFTFQAQQPPEEGGLLTFKGVFQGIDARGRPERLSGSGELLLQSAQLMRFTPYILDNATAGENPASLNAALTIKIDPDWQFSLSGTIDSDNMSAPLPGGGILDLGKSSLAFSARAGRARLLLDSYRLTFADNATLAGTCSLTGMHDSLMSLELTGSSNRIALKNIAKLAGGFEAVPLQARALLDNTARGSVQVTDAHLLAHPGKGAEKTKAKLTARVQLYDVLTQFSTRLPPLHISHAMLQLQENESLDAAITAHWPGTDNHTLNGTVKSIFHEPKISLHADSEIRAEGIETLIHAAAPELAAKISLPAGSLSAATRLDYSQQWTVSTALDLQQAEVSIAGKLSKPVGIPLRLQVKTALAQDMTAPLPLFFTILNGDAVTADGTVKSWQPLSCSGTYHAEHFDLSAFKMPDIAGLLTVSGTVSGSGTWRIPADKTDTFPVQGTCRLKDFSLVDAGTGKLLVGGSLDGAFESKAFNIFSCRAALGDTHGALSGSLTSLLPPRGRLNIVAELFDIDDFVVVIDHFIAVNEKLKQEQSSTATPIQNNSLLMGIDLEMPLKLKRLNLWNWDLDNGTSLWTFKNGVMDWDNVTLTGGGGPISGTVQLDFSKMPVRTLTLSPSRSQSDIQFVVPALRKRKTMTGTMDMSGWFSSTFSRKEDLGKNMNGKFHVTVIDGKLQKLTILSKILELMNLGHWFSFISQDILSTGMPYDTIKADFTVDHAVMKTENLQLTGPAMNLSAVGTIDMRSDEMNLIIGAQVLETFGKIIGAIPLAGSIVTGKDKTITLAYFKATGTYQDASVMPMPVKSLSAPVLKLIDSLLYFPKKLLHQSSESGSIKTDNTTQ